MSTTKITYYMDIDESGAVRGAGRVENALHDVEDQEHQTGTASIAMGNIIADVAQQIGVQFAQLPSKLFELGTSAQETASKYRTTLGPAVDQVNQFLDEFANKAGLSHQQGQELASTTAAMAQGMGFAERNSASYATQALKLAGDISSFNNAAGGTKEVLAGINAAVTGEREQLKKYGIVIRQTDVQQQALANTGKKSVDALTAQEKATATLQLITQRAGKAVGDLNRTQNSTQNTWRRLKAEGKDLANNLATKMLPAFHSLISSGLRIAQSDFFKSMVAGLGNAANAVAMLIAHFGDLAPVLLGAAAAYGTYKLAINATTIATKAAEIAQKAWNIAMEANPIGIVISALGALIGLLYSNGEAWQGFKTLISGVWDFLKQVFFNLPEIAVKSFSLLNEIVTAPFKLLKNFAGNVFSSLSSNFFHFLKAIKQGITGDFAGAWDQLSSIGQSAGQSFTDAASQEMSKIGDRVNALTASANFDPAVAKMADGGAQMGQALADTFTFTAQTGLESAAGKLSTDKFSQILFGDQLTGHNSQSGHQGTGQGGAGGGSGGAGFNDASALAAKTALPKVDVANLDNAQKLVQKMGKHLKKVPKHVNKISEAWDKSKDKIKENTKRAVKYSDTVGEAIKKVISGLINQVVALYVRAALQSASLSGPAAFLVAPALTAGATKAAHAIMDPLMSFESGGLLEGPRHRDGGILANLGGRDMVELEGQEYVTNRRSARQARPVLDAINSSPQVARQISDSYVGGSGALTINAMPASSSLAQSDTRDIASEVSRGIEAGMQKANIIAPVQLRTLDEEQTDERDIQSYMGNNV